MNQTNIMKQELKQSLNVDLSGGLRSFLAATTQLWPSFSKTIGLAFGLAIFAVGCASGPKYSEYRLTVPPPPVGEGRIWFYRPSSLGAAVQPAINLDNKVVGSAVPHGFFHVETSPGEHTVSATTEWTHKTSINVTTNQDSYVRLNMMIGLFVGHVIPKEVPESQGTNDMKNLHLTGAN